MSLSDDEDELQDSTINMSFLMLLFAGKLLKQGKLIDPRQLLPLETRRIISGTIRRKSLQHPSRSTFWKVYNANQDESMIQLVGFHKKAFDDLVELFSPVYEKYTPHATKIRRVKRRAGRTRLLCAKSCLGLVLTWLRSRGGNRILCLLYGILPSSCSVWLRYGKRVLLRVLEQMEEAKVKMPTIDEVQMFQRMISTKYPSLQDCWGAMDGLKIEIEVPKDEDTQNMFYNGWKCGHYISNLFLFSPNGKICACYFNAPGTVHDSTMANRSGIYERIDEVYVKTGGRVVVDSAFGKRNHSSLIKSFANNIDQQGRARQRTSVNRDATSVRQLSEWGMRGLQGSFPRLKERIRWEERGERKLMMQLVIYLYNYRAEKVGFNQIATVYKQSLEETANMLGDT